MSGPGVPATMRAAYVERLGAPEEIRIGELPVPAPGPTDVLVAVELVAVNPVDTYVRSGRYRTPVSFPFVVGRDLVGTVIGAGPGAPFGPGDRVWANSLGHDGRQGSFAQYAVVPAARCYRVPEGADPALVVALAHPAATAYLGWFVHGGLRPGDVVYVGGGAGNVGTAAISMARRAGAWVVASARPADHGRCREAGAHAVVDFAATDVAERIGTAASRAVDVFWDTSGHHDLDLAARVAAPGGRILLSAAQADRPVLPVRELYTRDVSLRGFVISRATAAQLADAARLVGTMVADGGLVARISEVLALDATAEVHARLEAGTVSGRVLLRP
ncbi:MAG: NADPH:quinone reductase [Acidimicrobiales bacterium]